MVLRYTGTCGYGGAPWLRGRRQLVTALSVPYNPPRSGIRVGVHKVSMAWQTRPGDLLVHLKFSSNSSHITCMIINCSLHCYIRTCQLHIGTFFIHCFPFILEVNPDVCPLSSKYRFYPCHKLCPSCKYVIMFIPMLDTNTLPSCGKI
jgi:hypothetical protein